MGNLSKYANGYSIEAAQAELSYIQESNGGDFIKPKVGTNVYRVLPPINGRSPFVLVHRHFVKLPGLARPAVFNCPRLMAKRDCAVCRTEQRLKSTGIAADMEMAKQLYAQLNIYLNVIDRAAEELGPQKLQITKTVHKALVDIKSDTRKGGDFTNPDEDGFDIIVERTGTGQQDTRYAVAASRQSTPLHANEEQAIIWIESQADLMPLTLVPSDHEIAAMLAGAGAIIGGGGPVQGRVEGRQPVGRLPSPAATRIAGSAKPKRSAADDIGDPDVE